MVFGETHTNLIFDLVVPYGYKEDTPLGQEIEAAGPAAESAAVYRGHSGAQLYLMPGRGRRMAGYIVYNGFWNPSGPPEPVARLSGRPESADRCCHRFPIPPDCAPGRYRAGHDGGGAVFVRRGFRPVLG